MSRRGASAGGGPPGPGRQPMHCFSRALPEQPTNGRIIPVSPEENRADLRLRSIAVSIVGNNNQRNYLSVATVKVGIGPWTFASVILLVAIAFIVAQSRLFLFLHRIG